MGRRTFFENLISIKNAIIGPRLCIGDFNTFLLEEEKKCGHLLPSSSSNIFNDFVDEAELIDFGFSDNPFLGTIKEWEEQNIQIRLDRGLANRSCHLLFPKAMITNLQTESDHRPPLMNTTPVEASRRSRSGFPEMWTRDDSSYSTIEKAWIESVMTSHHLHYLGNSERLKWL